MSIPAHSITEVSKTGYFMKHTQAGTQDCLSKKPEVNITRSEHSGFDLNSGLADNLWLVHAGPTRRSSEP